jgi:hypothetical protein
MDHVYVLEKSNLQFTNVANFRMALMELRILISSMILKYTWSGVPDKPGKWDEEMRPFDTMSIHPWNGKCVVELKPRNGS